MSDKHGRTCKSRISDDTILSIGLGRKEAAHIIVKFSYKTVNVTEEGATTTGAGATNIGAASPIPKFKNTYGLITAKVGTGYTIGGGGINTGAGNPIPIPKLSNKFGSAFHVIGTRKDNTRIGVIRSFLISFPTF